MDQDKLQELVFYHKFTDSLVEVDNYTTPIDVQNEIFRRKLGSVEIDRNSGESGIKALVDFMVWAQAADELLIIKAGTWVCHDFVQFCQRGITISDFFRSRE